MPTILRHTSRVRSALLLLGVLVALATGCDISDPEPEPGRVVLVLEHTADGTLLALNEINYVNAAGNRYGVSLLEYIVTDVALVAADGTRVPIAAQHYHNAATGETKELVVTNVPGGTYSSLSFTFGISKARNTTGALPNELNYLNMAWPEMMGGGYHYMRLEGRYESGDGQKTFAVHTGPTGGTDFSVHVSLPIDATLDGGTLRLPVVMDVDAWLGGPNAYDFDDYPGMIMGDAAAQRLLQANGHDVFSIGINPSP